LRRYASSAISASANIPIAIASTLITFDFITSRAR
jgi:hypothetical protein